MKAVAQWLVAAGVCVALAPFFYETPLNHWMVWVAIVGGTMYGVAMLQHYWQFRPHRRSSSRRIPCGDDSNMPGAAD
jgi:protein-S-isoprenylcysteine O-methyltransferase Ste14